MTEEFSFRFDVVLSKRVKAIMDYYSNNYEKEIGGFIVGKIEDDKVYLEDILFPSQSVSTGEVDITAKDFTLMRKEYGDKCLDIIGNWHSHNSMGCFWSATDENECNKIFMESNNVGVFVVSSKGEHLIRIDINKPFNISMDKLTYEVEEDEEFIEEMKKIIEDKVKKTKEIEYTSFKDYNILDRYSNFGQDWVKNDKEDNGSWDKNIADEYEIECSLYNMFQQDKKNLTIKLRDINPFWVEEIKGVFGGNIEDTDKISGKLDMFFKFEDKTEFKIQKKEMKDLVKLLIAEDRKEEELLNGRRF